MKKLILKKNDFNLKIKMEKNFSQQEDSIENNLLLKKSKKIVIKYSLKFLNSLIKLNLNTSNL